MFIASVLLIAFVPLIAIIALIVKVTSPGPVLYAAERIGHCGRPFKFLKFRSMYKDADKRKDQLLAQNEQCGPAFKMKNDPRVTPIGRFLRKYSLDELPQLWNVIAGDMSLVGPRPPLRREVVLYDERSLQRLTVSPGITCYWQVSGRSNLTWAEWIDLDLKYIDEATMLVDLCILVRTPAAVLRGEGAY